MKTNTRRADGIKRLADLVKANQRPPLRITQPSRHLFDLSESELVERFQGLPKNTTPVTAGKEIKS